MTLASWQAVGVVTLVTFYVGALLVLLWVLLRYARQIAFLREALEQREEERVHSFDLPKARNHYGLWCSDLKCECDEKIRRIK